MINIKNILIPTDFSENAARAYAPAQQLAKHYDAKIDVIHIIPTLRYFNDDLDTLNFYPEIEEDLYSRFHKKTSGKMERLMSEHFNTELRGTGIIEIAPKPAKTITTYAADNNYDLIMMAATGKDEANTVRGDITEKVMRYSKVPVLSADHSTFEKIDRIMVPTDGSLDSLQALSWAVSLAVKYNASIRLFYVLEAKGLLENEGLKNEAFISDFENVYERIYDIVENFVRSSPNEGIRLKKETHEKGKFIYGKADNAVAIDMDVTIKEGVSAHQAITKYAPEHADIVVMAARGLSGINRLLLGSTTEKVVRHLELPILTIKNKQD
ncbi:MAG TPA: universal stress protein [Balneolaceae bacterium]|nr:universal stress protein [Balneolaceae bacterium]